MQRRPILPLLAAAALCAGQHSAGDPSRADVESTVLDSG
jgi:hypothetical protein